MFYTLRYRPCLPATKQEELFENTDFNYSEQKLNLIEGRKHISLYCNYVELQKDEVKLNLFWQQQIVHNMRSKNLHSVASLQLGLCL